MSCHRVAAIQMVSGYQLQANLDVVARLVAAAAADGAKLLVLPETFALFGAKQQELGIAEASPKASVRYFIRQLASQHRIWIVAGTIPVASCDHDNKPHASCFLFDDQGVEVSCYRKMHLFDVDIKDKQGSYRESDTYAAGDQVVVAETPFGKVGFAVCYDIRFPELFRAMLVEQVDIVVVPAAFTQVTGDAHWQALLRARAIETQCYIIGANQGGFHSDKRSTSGGSVIINGWGEVIAEMDLGEGYVLADIDTAALQKIRSDIPVSRHLRFETTLKK